jgi:hypothetical protein
MGTIDRSVNKIKAKAVDTEKVVAPVKRDEKNPKDKKSRGFKPNFINQRAYMGNPFFIPKRKKKK